LRGKDGSWRKKCKIGGLKVHLKAKRGLSKRHFDLRGGGVGRGEWQIPVKGGGWGEEEQDRVKGCGQKSSKNTLAGVQGTRATKTTRLN